MSEAKTWWFVFNPYSAKVPTVRHELLSDAIAEAERICRLESVKVHVLKCEGTWFPPQAPQPRWENRR
jgi:hypothetical protein